MQDSLIKLIKANSKYVGNEDLCEDFLSEATKRSLAVSSGVEDIKFIEAYLKKVVNTAILTVLKNNGRIRRANKSFISTNEISINESKFGSGNNFSLASIPDPKADFTEDIVNRDLINKVHKAIKAADTANISQNYYILFKMRYIENKKQTEIADELSISQSEVCKRLYNLVKIVKTNVGGY